MREDTSWIVPFCGPWPSSAGWGSYWGCVAPNALFTVFCMNQTSVQGPTKLRLILAAAIILSATIFAFGGQSPAEAAIVNKITICHRTHSTTNPYRRITVAVAAISKNNGHGDEGASNTHNKGTGVFDPTYSYPPNAKLWNDIIPDETNGGTALLAYNYSGAGAAIYNGTSFDGYDYAGFCTKMTAK